MQSTRVLSPSVPDSAQDIPSTVTSTRAKESSSIRASSSQSAQELEMRAAWSLLASAVM